jgi:acetate kinase
MYGVFDTAFHSTMQQKAYMYGLPYEYYSHYGVRKYGFHGISHQYMTNLLHELEPNAKKLITCHLGGGASICAVRDGISIDTSMGFTPLEGLIMATRAGDVDDGAISYIQALTGFNDQQMEEIENKRSGLLGISGYTSDLRTRLSDAQAGNTRAGLAIDMYIYRIQKYIGSFAAALDGVHALAISGGVGSGSDVIRKRMLSGLDFLHLMVSDKINGGRINVAENLRISTDFSVPVWVIPANEELQIAKEIALL